MVQKWRMKNSTQSEFAITITTTVVTLQKICAFFLKNTEEIASFSSSKQLELITDQEVPTHLQASPQVDRTRTPPSLAVGSSACPPRNKRHTRLPNQETGRQPPLRSLGHHSAQLSAKIHLRFMTSVATEELLRP